MRTLGMVFGGVALVATACSVKDPLYCQTDQDCADVAGRPKCDLTGEHEENHLADTCVADWTPDAGVPADAARVCTPSTVSCVASVLSTCNADGTALATADCALGCFTDGTRCFRIEASNSVAETADTLGVGPDITLSDGATIDTDTGLVINGDGASLSVPNMDGPTGGRVFVTGALSFGNVTVVGARPPMFYARGEVVVNGVLSVTARGKTPGPGGQASAILLGTCMGEYGMAASDTNPRYVGGAGGGHGGVGGLAGDNLPSTALLGGKVRGTPELVPLTGGCAGGPSLPKSIAPVRGYGGGGGGAVQVVSDVAIRVVGGTGAIVAGGGGGEPLGGGGGAGGGILLEAPIVLLTGAGAALAANGGGGGGGCSAPGHDAETADTAVGGACGSPTTSGGSGASGTGAAGDAAAYTGATTPSATGGGGGGIGRVRVNVPTGGYQPGPGTVVSGAITTGEIGRR